MAQISFESLQVDSCSHSRLLWLLETKWNEAVCSCRNQQCCHLLGSPEAPSQGLCIQLLHSRAGSFLWGTALKVTSRHLQKAISRKKHMATLPLSNLSLLLLRNWPKKRDSRRLSCSGILSNTWAMWPLTPIQNSTRKFTHPMSFSLPNHFSKQHSILQPLDIITPQTWVLHPCSPFFWIAISHLISVLWVYPQRKSPITKSHVPTSTSLSPLGTLTFPQTAPSKQMQPYIYIDDELTLQFYTWPPEVFNLDQ